MRRTSSLWSSAAATIAALSFLATTAHAALTEGPNAPGAVFNDAAFGTVLWTDPANAQASDDNVASAAPGMNNTQYLHANNFGFAIPGPALIVGIEVNIERRSVAGIIKDTRVRIVKGGVVGATERGDTVNAWPTVDTVKLYGGASDLWGEAWTAGDINAANFGVVLSVNGNGDFPQVDDINITVHYDLCQPAPQVGCRTATKSLLLVKDNVSDSTKDKLIFKWIKGLDTTQAEFAAPNATATYATCVYENNALSFSLIVPPSPSLWTQIGTKGWKYKDLAGTQNGVQKIIVKGSTGGSNKSKILVKGRGNDLPDPLPPVPGPGLDLPVKVQVINSDSGLCWDAEFNVPNIKKNTPTLFKGKN